MIIGIPREIKDHEYRVALTPVGAARLTAEGHRVLVQQHAGAGSGFPDEEYSKNGAHLVHNPGEIFVSADLIVKVKEPLESEYPVLCGERPPGPRPGLPLI